MNKTISINIGGAVFNIEETAFLKLKQYLDRIQQNFSGDSGEAEIMSDIEGRIAELFAQRMDKQKNVVDMKDVDEVIEIMGQPEDFITDENAKSKENNASNMNHDRRRIYRDGDDAFIGGVCSGLSYLLGWDPIILRIVFILLIFTGSGVLIYLIFWIVVPEAKTTAEKLRMRGEPVTVENISKFVSKEAKAASDRITKASERVSDPKRMKAFSSDFARLLLRGIGLIMIIFSIFVLIALVIGGFTANTEMIGNEENFKKINELVFFNDGTLWMLITGGLLAIVSPIIALLYQGVRLLAESTKRIKGLGWGLTILFFSGIIMVALGATRVAQEFRRDSEIKNTFSIDVPTNDTISIEVVNDTIFKGWTGRHRDEFLDLVIKQNDRLVFGGDVHFRLRTTDRGEAARVEIERTSSGSSILDAGERASRIKYEYTYENNTLSLPTIFTTPGDEKYRAQHVYVTMYVPVGTPIRLSNDIGKISWMDDEAGTTIRVED